jgi:hypothetical protein
MSCQEWGVPTRCISEGNFQYEYTYFSKDVDFISGNISKVIYKELRVARCTAVMKCVPEFGIFPAGRRTRALTSRKPISTRETPSKSKEGSNL